MIRGFEYVDDKFKCNSEDTPLPSRSTKNSAGYDFISPVDFILYPDEVFVLWTDVKAKMPEDECLKIYSRSSLATNKKLVLANSVGVIDSDYYGNPKNDGNIGIPILNLNKFPQSIKKGDKIAQGIFEKFFLADDDIVDNTRRSGFGSTGT